MLVHHGLGIILGSETIKSAIVNFSRPSIYSTSLPFPFVAAIRAGHRLLGTPEATKVGKVADTVISSI